MYHTDVILYSRHVFDTLKSICERCSLRNLANAYISSTMFNFEKDGPVLSFCRLTFQFLHCRSLQVRQTLKWVSNTTHQPPTHHHQVLIKGVATSHVFVGRSYTTSDGTNNGLLAKLYIIFWCDSFPLNKNWQFWKIDKPNTFDLSLVKFSGSMLPQHMALCVSQLVSLLVSSKKI